MPPAEPISPLSTLPAHLQRAASEGEQAAEGPARAAPRHRQDLVVRPPRLRGSSSSSRSSNRRGAPPAARHAGRVGRQGSGRGRRRRRCWWRWWFRCGGGGGERAAAPREPADWGQPAGEGEGHGWASGEAGTGGAPCLGGSLLGGALLRPGPPPPAASPKATSLLGRLQITCKAKQTHII